MSSILLITSSPRGEASHSTRLATELAEKLVAARPGNTLVKRDLAREPLPHITPDFASGIFTAPESRSAAQARVVVASDAAADELLAADTVVIGVGMINFGIPSTLKSWFDHVVRAGRTFRYTENGPEGLAGGKKVYLVVASGGIYSQGPAAALDHAVPYMKTILGFVGLTDIEVIRVEGIARGMEAEAVAAAQSLIGDYAVAA